MFCKTIRARSSNCALICKLRHIHRNLSVLKLLEQFWCQCQSLFKDLAPKWEFYFQQSSCFKHPKIGSRRSAHDRVLPSAATAYIREGDERLAQSAYQHSRKPIHFLLDELIHLHASQLRSDSDVISVAFTFVDRR